MPEKPHKHSVSGGFLPSKTGLVWIVNVRVLIRPPVLTVSSTVNLFRWPAIVTDSCRDVFF
jgi:hypothetical protein